MDSGKILSDKRKLRKEILEKLKSQDKKQALKSSDVIKKKLFKLEKFKKAKCVIFYVSMPEEVSTHDMIDESIRIGKTVGVPVVVSARGGGKKELAISKITDRKIQLENGPYGVKQPKAAEIKPIACGEMDLVLVPAVAFDKSGNRLGRGKGYYDRFLKKLPRRVLTIGLCFDFQVVKFIPKLPHDIPVKTLLGSA